jgi:hypothetical protein
VTLFRIVRREAGSGGPFEWNGGRLYLSRVSADEALARIQRAGDHRVAVGGSPYHEYKVFSVYLPETVWIPVA